MDSLNNLDFKKLTNQQKSIQMKMRLLALAHFKDGHSRTQIAKFLKVSRTSVNQWVHTFLEEGLEGLKEKPKTGRPPFLTSKQREQLSQYIKDKANDTLGGRLIGADIHSYIVKEFSQHSPLILSITCSSTWASLDNFSLQAPSSVPANPRRF